MPVTDSRISGATLTLDSVGTHAKQFTEITLTPAANTTGEELETITGDVLGAAEDTRWTMDLGAIQDFVDPQGLTEWARANAGRTVDYVLTPNTADAGPSYAGKVTVRALPIGGAPRSRLVNTSQWPCVGEPVPTYPAP